MVRKFKGGKIAPDNICNAREGVVIFDSKLRAGITPGNWKEKDGGATNVRWWDFIGAEKAARTKRQISYEIRYDKNRKRISIIGIPPESTNK